MIATGEVTARERFIAVILAAICWFAIAAQYRVSVGLGEKAGLPLAETTIQFFSYFTIQTNILIGLVLLGFAIRPTFDEWTVHPFVRSAIASYIAVVGLVYATVLHNLWAPTGLHLVADTLLHYVMPIAYIVFWLLLVRKAGLRWYDPLLWLIYPAFYLAAVLIRARWSGFYPYPFIDASKLTLGQLAANAIGVMILFLVSGIAVLTISRLMARREPV